LIERDPALPRSTDRAGTYRGRDEVIRLEEFLDAWDDLAVTVEKLVDAGDRCGCARCYSWRGPESGIQISGADTDAQAWTVRNGKALRVELGGGTAEALKAAGMSE
jgi:hypothetical protein